MLPCIARHLLWDMDMKIAHQCLHFPLRGLDGRLWGNGPGEGWNSGGGMATPKGILRKNVTSNRKKSSRRSVKSRSGCPAKSSTSVSPPTISANLDTSVWNCCAQGCACEEIPPLSSRTGWTSKEKWPNIHAYHIECNEVERAIDWYHLTRRMNNSSLQGKSRRKAKTAEEGIARCIQLCHLLVRPCDMLVPA